MRAGKRIFKKSSKVIGPSVDCSPNAQPLPASKSSHKSKRTQFKKLVKRFLGRFGFSFFGAKTLEVTPLNPTAESRLPNKYSLEDLSDVYVTAKESPSSSSDSNSSLVVPKITQAVLQPRKKKPSNSEILSTLFSVYGYRLYRKPKLGFAGFGMLNLHPRIVTVINSALAARPFVQRYDPFDIRNLFARRLQESFVFPAVLPIVAPILVETGESYSNGKQLFYAVSCKRQIIMLEPKRTITLDDNMPKIFFQVCWNDLSCMIILYSTRLFLYCKWSSSANSKIPPQLEVIKIVNAYKRLSLMRTELLPKIFEIEETPKPTIQFIDEVEHNEIAKNQVVPTEVPVLENSVAPQQNELTYDNRLDLLKYAESRLPRVWNFLDNDYAIGAAILLPYRLVLLMVRHDFADSFARVSGLCYLYNRIKVDLMAMQGGVEIEKAGHIDEVLHDIKEDLEDITERVSLARADCAEFDLHKEKWLKFYAANFPHAGRLRAFATRQLPVI